MRRKILQVLLWVFALIGFIFTGVYVAMQLHLTNVAGSIDARNAFFKVVKKEFPILSANAIGATNKIDPVTECQIMTINSLLPENGRLILDAYTSTRSPIVAEKMVRAVEIVTANNLFLQDKLHRCSSLSNNITSIQITPSNQTIFDWMMSDEWHALRDALIKDKDVILEASANSGVPARLIVDSVISEQFRFFTSNRESFKSYFEPLKILGNGTKFSYGVAGVKMETAEVIENNLKNINSPFYPGPKYENILDYKVTDDPASERLMRLTDINNHYYSYLYTGVFLKEIIAQWQNAGYPISDRPEVLATLFNLGFYKSVPKADPEVGGSTITISDRDYTFGGLAFEFYYSGELSDIFPLGVE